MALFYCLREAAQVKIQRRIVLNVAVTSSCGMTLSLILSLVSPVLQEIRQQALKLLPQHLENWTSSHHGCHLDTKQKK